MVAPAGDDQGGVAAHSLRDGSAQHVELVRADPVRRAVELQAQHAAIQIDQRGTRVLPDNTARAYDVGHDQHSGAIFKHGVTGGAEIEILRVWISGGVRWPV